MERKVQSGLLVQYVAGRDHQQEQQNVDRTVQTVQTVPPVQPAPIQPPRHVVDVITGGTTGKLVGKKRRGYLDSVMSMAGVLPKTDRPFPGTVDVSAVCVLVGGLSSDGASNCGGSVMASADFPAKKSFKSLTSIEDGLIKDTTKNRKSHVRIYINKNFKQLCNQKI